MTPKNMAEPPDEESRGVLDDAASLDTAVIGNLGNTAQVSVVMPKDEDDDLEDDGVVDGEVVADLIIDEPVAAARAAAETVAAAEISIAPLSGPLIIELPPEPTGQQADPAPEEPEADPAPEEPEAESASTTATQTGVETQTGPQEDDAHPSSEHDAAPEPDSEGDPAPSAQAEDDIDRDSDSHAEIAEVLPEGPASSARTAQTGADPVTSSAADSAGDVRGDDDARAAADAAEAAAAAAFIARAQADIDARAASRTAPTRIRTATKESTAVDIPDKSVVPRQTRSTRADVQLSSKRLDDLGDSSRESADLLTADRLLDPHRVTKPEPEGAWSHFLYTISGRRINIGDGRRARERKALSARIAAPLVGGARFVPVLSRKGGVGKTTITALLGMALADARDDRVIAVDANPDRGTLAERIVRPPHNRSVRDLVRIHDEVKGYHDISAIVARDATRLDVLASDADPRIAEAFSDSDYRDVAGVAAHYYSLVLTDTGTGIVHSVMSATLDLADQIVIVSGLSVDEARLASETLTWLETNGYAEQAREAVVVLNQSTPGAPLVRLNELEAHFRTRAAHVVRMPYDAQIAGGGTIVFTNLQPETRVAARELAALLVEGLRAKGA
ncbi:hypothetical protein A4X16_03580 [Microbacterium sp. H83]|nr:MinD/ParA family protein [Microbacterium sp. H83]OAN38471.1 hypothetical protein A4X16_03580 [Microbacterium sp. H83]